MKSGDQTCFGDNFSSPLNLIQARCRSAGGLSSAVHRAAFASARTLPPPRRSGLRIHPSLRSDLICSARRPRSRLGTPARLRRSGGRRRFALSAAREPRCAPIETHSARASAAPPAPGFTHARGTGETQFLPTHRQPAAARLRSRLSLSAWKSAAPTQAGPLRPKTFLPHPSASTACRRPSLRSDAGSTMAATRTNACHRPSIHRGSRLGFYRSSVAAISSSHRLTAARFRSLPGETRLTKGFCPYPPPIRQ